MAEISDLLCCPFCGGKADINKEGRGEDTLDDVWVVGCISCPAEMVGDRYEGDNDFFKDELLDTIGSWNERTT